MPWSKKTHAPQLQRLCSEVCQPQQLIQCAATTEALTSRACALQQEKPLQ